ncbi:unnamed protein product, partial [Heterotrigona itama]
KLAGRTIFVTGASRGIGKSIALKAARDGANIVVAAKTAEPHSKLPGTVYTAAEEIEQAGGKALPCVVDVRDEARVVSAVENAVQKFGGIDVVVNNASAISLTGTESTDMKKYDLMNDVNARGTFLTCLPYLKKSKNPHIVNISPPLSMKPIWFKNHVAYTIAKYGMSMCALGMAEEFKDSGIAVNTVWPRTAIYTAAVAMLSGAESSNYSRKPEIMADAVYALICKDGKSVTGQFLIDEEILRNEGITDFADYACDPENKDNLMLDFFVDENLRALGSRDRTLHEATRKDLQSADESNEKIARIFKVVRANLNSDLVDETGAIFQFNVKGMRRKLEVRYRIFPEPYRLMRRLTGNEAGTWFLDLKTGKGSAGRGEPGRSPDATLTMDSDNFFAMFSGKLKPTSAFVMGKLRISGDLRKVMKLEKLMNLLKSKL